MDIDLFDAVENNDAERVLAILKRGVDANLRDTTGTTALHYAVINGNVRMVAMLIAHGADVNSRVEPVRTDPLNGSRSNWSVLQWAAEHNQAECAQLLLDGGADIEAIDEDGTTALYRSLDEVVGPDVARLLVSRGADINTALDDGPVYIEKYQRFDILEKLINEFPQS